MSVGPDLEALLAAHARIRPHIHRTQVLTCQSLDAQAGARLFFKCENFQKTGSFKMRGAANAVFSLANGEARRGVLTHSSGNHAAALARAASRRGISAWIVMPENASPAKRAAALAYGGRIVTCASTLEARERTAGRLQAETGATLIPPYDDCRVIAGQGTAALELLGEIPDLEVLVVPVGGGGLASGTAIAAKSTNPRLRVIAAEPATADDAFRSLSTGKLTPSGDPQTVADGLRTSLSPLTFAILRERLSGIVLVSEEEIVAAMWLIWERMKIVVEPSAAVAAAAAFERRLDAQGGRVGIILSGGNVDLSRLPFAASPRGRSLGAYSQSPSAK
jgi:threonine dehydratase